MDEDTAACRSDTSLVLVLDVMGNPVGLCLHIYVTVACLCALHSYNICTASVSTPTRERPLLKVKVSSGASSVIGAPNVKAQC